MKATRTGILSLLLLGAAPIAAVQAQGFGPLPYDFITLNYAMTELDSGGLEIGGSMEIVDRVDIFALYQDWEIGDRYDRKAFKIGGGYRWDLRPNLDFIAKLAYGDNEFDPPGQAKFDADGLIVSGEFRGWLSQSIEISGEVFIDNSVRSGTESIVEFGGQYFLDRNMSIGGRLRVDESETTLFVGARFYFGASNRGRNGP